MSLPAPRAAPSSSPSAPSYFSHVPGLVLVGGSLFLGAGVFFGARRGLASAVADAENGGGGGGGGGGSAPRSAQPLTLRAAVRSDPGIAVLGARALLYGTLLALGGCGVLVVGAAWALDVRSPQDFTDKLRGYGPSARARFEGRVRPAVDALSGGGRAAAKGVDESVGAALRSSVPRVTTTVQDEYAGLSKRDKRALDEFLALFNDDKKEVKN
jgi:hypothetical protein